jgi:hypothetical protein
MNTSGCTLIYTNLKRLGSTVALNLRNWSAMLQFIVYFICGFCVAWLNLFMWGFSNGPASAAPYLAVVGSLFLFVIVSPLALFLPRIAASVGLVAVLLILLQPFYLLLIEHSFTAFAMTCLMPAIIGFTGARYLLKTRNEKWLMASSSPPLLVRIPLGFLPLVLFVCLFNARLILSLLLEGPPK